MLKHLLIYHYYIFPQIIILFYKFSMKNDLMHHKCVSQNHSGLYNCLQMKVNNIYIFNVCDHYFLVSSLEFIFA